MQVFWSAEHGGRVVKALDLSSNGSNSAWVRTPPVLRVLFPSVGISCYTYKPVKKRIL